VNFFVRFGTAKAHREDVGPRFDGPLDTRDDVLGGSGPFIVKNFGRDDFGFGSDSDDSFGVTSGGDDS